MQFTIKYKPGSNPIKITSDKKSIEEIADDVAFKLTRNYMGYLGRTGTVRTDKQLAKYRLGQKYLILAALESARGG